MWLTSYLWPWNIALPECSLLTFVTGGPSLGREVSGDTITSLSITGKASQKRWGRLTSAEGRERSKGRPEEFGSEGAKQLLKPWLPPLPCVFLLVGFSAFYSWSTG